MPSMTGPLDDNATELAAVLLGLNLSDLPFNAYFVDGQTIALPPLVVSHPGAFEIRGTAWPPVTGHGWWPVVARPWAAVEGTAWRDIRRPR